MVDASPARTTGNGAPVTPRTRRTARAAFVSLVGVSLIGSPERRGVTTSSTATRARLQLHETERGRAGHRLHARSSTELPIELRDVGLNRPRRDAQSGRDLSH